MPTRLEQLQALLEKSPTDQFLRYGIAMEHSKAGDVARAMEYFDGLMHDPVPHVPSFFMAAQALAADNQITEARSILRAGIEQARQQGNGHAAGEMGELLMTLGSLGE